MLIADQTVSLHDVTTCANKVHSHVTEGIPSFAGPLRNLRRRRERDDVTDSEDGLTRRLDGLVT